jgi:hypothetical protein
MARRAHEQHQSIGARVSPLLLLIRAPPPSRPSLPERGSRGERRNRGDGGSLAEKIEPGGGEKQKGERGEGSWRWENKIWDIRDRGEI